ncbi:serine/threonine protein kinase ppk15, putative [Entamoeba invadens IP1]|uniref:Serine/threonine protein kinase ppk15, putative n=1 Tax=Entamoeba invadens IP1 TaxID=370355 RepID=A0A0A1U053_ENTIV|nr:serine/threonine protein kinase ppk15, putative [Entamoeba invadens IP1]ELP87267.1 serine/threonine protein kinase ppk15, putative [Entamoeba invadens IP1]|eukprot:XP_004254038.1 serine/threonine protein kinase ppk15, putative [Entamoeba invadens IP1]
MEQVPMASNPFSHASAFRKESVDSTLRFASQHKRPLYALTLDLITTLKVQQRPLNSYKYLTDMSEPYRNNGKDNAGYGLIVAVDDYIGSMYSKEEDGCSYIPESQYVVISSLGSGTFGQVFKCRNCKDNTLVAIKILRSKLAFFRQGMLEIAVLTALRDLVDTEGKYHTIKMVDYFLYYGHVCIVTELLSVSLYDVLRSHNNVGMGLTFNRQVLRQVLESLHGLSTMNIIHCDIKTENLLLIGNTADIKLIDFGSACFERSTLYTYIQSRHYRAIEIILGLPYSCAIDMWSFGCVAAELFLGIPLFPGENEYNQLLKITEILGPIPDFLLQKGTKTCKYYNGITQNGKVVYIMKSRAEYERENNVKLAENRKYFKYTSLKEICENVPFHRNAFVRENDGQWRAMFYDFLKKVLDYDPIKRLTPSEALTHPFIKSKTTKQELLSLPLPLIPQDVSMEDVVRRVYGNQYSLFYLQTRDRFFSIHHNYFTAFIRALKCGYVLNTVYPNPFKNKPLKVIAQTNFSWRCAEEDNIISWGSNSDSEESRRTSSLQSPSSSMSPRISLRPPIADPRRFTTMVRDTGHYSSFGTYSHF